MIACVEDDSEIRELEVYTLRSTGFEAVGFESGEPFFEALKTKLPELVLLDIMLPGDDGITILRKLRADTETAGIPVIMATARGSEYDTVQGLDLGADDYLAKPFGMMEMVSRVRAVLRRSSPQGPAGPRMLQNGSLVMNLTEHTVSIDQKPVDLTIKEFEVLHTLMEHPGMVFTREQLLSQVWDFDFYGETRTVDVHINTLRQKLGPYGANISTVRGMGYRLERLSS